MFSMFRGGRPDLLTLMAVDYEDRQEKLQAIVDYVQESTETNVDISNICKKLDIQLTRDEFNWIVEQVSEE